MAAAPQGKSRATMSEINVTPLVDVMLVLLIMFMVTAPMMQQGLEVEIPQTAPTGMDTPEEAFRLVITADRRVRAGKQNIPVDDLRERLQAIFKTRQNKDVQIEADARVDYGFVAQVMAEIRGAGITSIGLVTRPKE